MDDRGLFRAALLAGLCGLMQSALAEPALRARDTTAASGGPRRAGDAQLYATCGSWQAAPAGCCAETELRHSYIATLFDPVAVQIEADSDTLLEGSVTPLAASIVCDDATRMDAGSDIAWSVLAGPLSVGAGSGVATAGIVYADAPAYVAATTEGASGSRQLTVANVNRDDYPGYASDGLADDWQMQHFGPTNDLATGAADPDGDGQNNQFEFIAGTQPTNAASSFALGIRPGARVDVAFAPAYTSRVYGVEYTTNLRGGVWLPLTNGSEIVLGEQHAVRGIEDAPSADYRVRIRYDWETPP